MSSYTADKSFERYKKTVLDIIHKQLPNAEVYLFGSRARGDDRTGSDIDIALDAGCLIDQKSLFHISEDLENSTIPFFIDVVDLHNVAEDFKAFIQKDMVLWKS